jgi:hypothetical protein
VRNLRIAVLCIRVMLTVSVWSVLYATSLGEVFYSACVGVGFPTLLVESRHVFYACTRAQRQHLYAILARQLAT